VSDRKMRPAPDDAGPACPACKGRGWNPGDCHPREVCGTCNGTGYPESWAAKEIARLDAEVYRLRAPAAHGESATARVHYVEHRIREDVGFWVAEPREQSGAAAVYASRQMKGTTALVYALDIHDALTFATKTECEEWIRARELPLVACEHLVVSSLPPAPSAPTTREADVPPAGLRCLACEVRPATRYARDAEGFGFALCGACRLDDEVPAAPASERKP
jgi:hypothetical protein